MSRTDVKIFIASSGELNDERNESLKVIVEVNKNFSHLHLEPILFELDTATGNNPGKKRIQDGINPLLDQSDIVIILFYSRIGEFTKEEFDRAEANNKKIFLYLKKGFEPSNTNESIKYTEVLTLKETIEKESEIRYQPYKTIDDYNGLLYKDLNKYIAQKYPLIEPLNTSDFSLPSSDTATENKLNLYPKSKQYFTGREVEIGAFKKALDDNNTFIAIDGPGGIGKTQFVSRCIEKYIPSEKVIWYDCTSTSQLDTLISSTGYPELLKGTDKTDREKFSAYKDKIQENGFYLFLDNFQETNHNSVFKEFLFFIQEYLQKGCVIIIDRDDIRSIKLTPKRIHISEFKENKLEYAKALISHSYKDDVNISDNELELLCEQLRGYPLAIDFGVLLLSEGVTPSDIITEIIQGNNHESISDTLLNAIFSRPDATKEERNFIRQFSVFTGNVSQETVNAIIDLSLIETAPKKLQKKNLLSFSNGYYSIHPLVREFCYKEYNDKPVTHAKIGQFYIQKRTENLDPELEEQIFYHLIHSNQWEKIQKELEDKGRQFILAGQLGLLKELLDKLTELNFNKPIFNIFFGDIAEIQGDWEQAQKYFDIARVNVLDKKVKAEGIIKYGEIIHRKGDFKEALPFYEEAYKFSNINNLLYEEARALNDIGLVYYLFGDFDNAHEKYLKSIKIKEIINDNEGVATTYYNIAAIYDFKGQYDEALEYHNKSLNIRQNIGAKIGLAESLNSIASIYIEDKKHDIALEKCEESIKIAKATGKKTSIATIMLNFGAILCAKKDFNGAMKMYNDSLKIREEIGDKAGIAVTYNEIGNLFSLQNHFNEAIANYKKNLIINEERGNSLSIAVTSNNIGLTYARHLKTDFDLALFYLFRGYALCNKINAKPRLKISTDWIIFIREKKISLNEFKAYAQKAYDKLPNDLKQFIEIKSFFKEPIRVENKTGRNDPCPCGSGRKYKNCHGVN